MIKVFLLMQPGSIAGKVIYADSEDEARGAIHDPIYSNEELSECKQIAVDMINSYRCNSVADKLDAVMIKYQNKTYHLRKNVAEEICLLEP